MRLLRIPIIIQLCALLFTVSEGDLFSQDRFTADKEVSRLWIEGSSNVNTFDCVANDYHGKAELAQRTTEDSKRDLSLRVDIEVEGFDCGKRKMNRDLKEALKADRYPEITFIFSEAEIADIESPESSVKFRVKGSLTVAGVTREISFLADGELLENGRKNVRGSKQIQMTDYNITPPTGLFGLIKADDELTVHFDLIAKRI